MDEITSVSPDDRPGYYAIIPADVRYDDSIPANAKLLYGEISALISKDGFCYASNAYFAAIYQLNERTIKGLVAALRDAGYIKVFQEKDQFTGKVLRRKIYLRVSTPDGQGGENIFTTPGKSFPNEGENIFPDTNTSITNIEEKNKKENPKSKQKTPPKEDFDPMPLFVDWIRKNLSDGWTSNDQNNLYQALARFCDNRKAIKHPVRSKAAVTALCNRLARYCGSNIPAMIDLLDTATSSGWQSVYPPKSQNQDSTPDRRNEIWL